MWLLTSAHSHKWPGLVYEELCRSRRVLSKKKNCSANFPHLQPMAEMRRNQRGEIGLQHVKGHSCSHFSPCFDHTSPTQTDDGTSQIDHDIRAYVPYSFWTMSWVLLCPHPTVQSTRMKETRPTLNVTAQRRNHLNWEGVSQLAWSHQFF